MRIPEQYKCDFCKKEIKDYSSGKHTHSIPVLTNCEWTEGRSSKERIAFNHYDICKECMMKITNVKAGFQGRDPKFIKGE